MEGKNNFGDFSSPKFFGMTAGLAPKKNLAKIKLCDVVSSWQNLTINPETAKGFAFSQNKKLCT